MITRSDLRKAAQEYLQSAELLKTSRKYGMSVYLCGYTVAIALKERICRALKWPGFPATAGEFNFYRSFQTHNLEVLLDLTAIGNKIKAGLGGTAGVVEYVRQCGRPRVHIDPVSRTVNGSNYV